MSAESETKVRAATEAFNLKVMAFDAASGALDHHDAQIRAKTKELAQNEELLRRHRTSVALGEPCQGPSPDVADIETLRVDIDIAGQVSGELARRRAEAENAVADAARDKRAAVREYLWAIAVPAGQTKVRNALWNLQLAASELMAAHYLTTIEFADPNSHSVATFDHGPAEKLFRELQELRWDEAPYSVRPDWFGQARLTPYNLPEVTTAKQRLRDDLARKAAR